MADDVWECIKQSNPIYANLCAQAPNHIACHATNLSKRLLLICTASPFSLIGKGKTLEEADSSGNFSEYWKIKPMAGSTTNHSESNFQKIGGFNISQSCLCIRAEYQNTNTYYIVSLNKSNLLLLLYLDDKVRKTLE